MGLWVCASSLTSRQPKRCDPNWVMAKGRIKRLQLASSWQGQSFKADALEVCALCEREIPHRLKDAHHLTPKSRGGVVTVFLHRACHKQVHALFTETELA